MEVFDVLGNKIKRGDYLITKYKSHWCLVLCYGFENCKNKIKIIHDYNFLDRNVKNFIKIDDDKINYFFENIDDWTIDDYHYFIDAKKEMFIDHTPEFDNTKSNKSHLYHRIYDHGRIKSYDNDGFAKFK